MRSRSACGACSRSSLPGIAAGRSDDRHLAQRAHDAPHVGAVGDHRPARRLHHFAHIRLAHHAARPAGRGGALPWCRSRGDTSGDAVPQIVRGDAHDHAHPSPLHGGDLRADRARGGVVRAGVRAVETLAHRRAVRGVAGVLFGHVAHAIRRSALQLAARSLQRAPRRDVLRAVVRDPARAAAGGAGRNPGVTMDVSVRGPRLEPRTRGAMNRRQFVGTLGTGLGLVFVPRLPRWRADDVFVERWSWAMGQPVHLMVFAGSEQEGLDRALQLLRARGLRRAFIDVSGDMAAIGAPPGEPGWRVDIAEPDRPGAGRAVATTRLRDAALATAANTESIVRYGSLVAGHVMDPATGWPARALRQASVVTRTAVAADALSTAMLVSGRRPEGVLLAYRV